MSKSNLCENREVKRYKYLSGLMLLGMKQKELISKDIGKKTGIPERTVRDRIQHPERARLRDLYQICDAVGVKVTFELKDKPE